MFILNLLNYIEAMPYILGTRTMYKFVREELGVPFYCGHTSIDTSLNTILDAIKQRDIEDVLLNIFTL